MKAEWEGNIRKKATQLSNTTVKLNKPSPVSGRENCERGKRKREETSEGAKLYTQEKRKG